MEPLEFEHMSWAFSKVHIRPHGVVHKFFEPEPPDADPHDHPCDMTIYFFHSGYVEEIFTIEPDGRWSCDRHIRKEGDVIELPANRIHRIIKIIDGPCFTFATYGPMKRETHFYRFAGSEVLKRHWNSKDWALA